MAGARKRRSGGGRKPKGPLTNKVSTFSTRITPQTREAIDRDAALTGLSVSQAAERLIQIGLETKRRRESDRPLRALLFLIETLALTVGGGQWIVAAGSDDYREAVDSIRDEWRTDKFRFRAFKLAVSSLLDALEPPGEIMAQLLPSAGSDVGDNDPVRDLMRRVYERPENLAAFHFSNLWTRLHRSHPLSAREKEILSRGGHVGQMILEEFYGLDDARRDLGLETASPAAK